MIIAPYARLTSRLTRLAPLILPTLARFAFAATLLVYYIRSGLLKFDGISLDPNAYIQILPRAMERAGYDPSQLGAPYHLIVWGGSMAELILPVLIVLGLATRPAALAMIGFIAVQSGVDITGHGVDSGTIGAWFDNQPGAMILDQRLFWITTLTIPLFLGAGPLSLDRLIYSKAS